ncbi:2TM domain-containing protein [Chryseobacterium sp. MEBOG06]|uniref:2TM domain-containing protein n=1 Tax=Chryseobacterium sp. MEBOG06 TaxID=2879938 RepID=UPI001F3D4807|nr:2TM domain-containing protein [Chryseobacterium sp. MEBOG06]UKB83993.1 2TM domain-containing protein [Chryseobacterium sp. MEBOG06]
MDYHTAYTRTRNIKKFYRNIFLFAIIALLILPDTVFDEEIIRIRLFDRYTILAIWGLILFVKAIKLFVFDSEWERDMIERELKKDKQPIDY